MKKRKMAIEIKEYVGHEFVSVNATKETTNLQEGYVETYCQNKLTKFGRKVTPKCKKKAISMQKKPHFVCE